MYLTPYNDMFIIFYVVFNILLDKFISFYDIYFMIEILLTIFWCIFGFGIWILSLFLYGMFRDKMWKFPHF